MTRAAADRPAWGMPPNVDELTRVFEKGRQYKDVPRIPWPEMGYSVWAWNGLDPPYGASLSVSPGGYADSIRHLPNTIDLTLKPAVPGNADLINSTVLKQALLSVATAWEPDYAVVVTWDYWRRSFGGHYPLFRSGWMTYLAPQHAMRITPPPAAIVEPIAGGGMLLVATEARFDTDDPAHLAVADAVQAALAPLQEADDSGRDTPPGPIS